MLDDKYYIIRWYMYVFYGTKEKRLSYSTKTNGMQMCTFSFSVIVQFMEQLTSRDGFFHPYPALATRPVTKQKLTETNKNLENSSRLPLLNLKQLSRPRSRTFASVL